MKTTFTSKLAQQQNQSRMVGIWHRCTQLGGIVGEMF